MKIKLIDHIDNNWVLGKTFLLDYLESFPSIGILIVAFTIMV